VHLHFVGIGGIGMSGLARIFLQAGYTVSGSDIKETSITKKLRSQGAHIYNGHRANQIEGADMVVFSSAISAQNPEIKEAQARKVPLISRGKLVAQIANMKENIIVAGTHGKTTTTALIAELLLREGLDFTLLIGGILKKINSNSQLGIGRWMLVESDESDGSFLYFHPTIAIVTNIENDHLNYYYSLKDLLQAFTQFLKKVKPEGKVIVNIDDPRLRYILRKIPKKKNVSTYGLCSKADISAFNINLEALKSSFEVRYKKNSLGRIEVPLPGMHNIYNCLAMIGVGITLGVSWEKIRKTFFYFKGVKRRLEKIGEVKDILIFDDYAHHPTEIKATLNEIKRLGKRVIVIFQPHRYTRTKLLWEEFTVAFDKVDLLLLTDIYPAGEVPLPGVDGKLFFEAVRKKRKSPTYYIPSKSKIIEFVKKEVKKKDIILTLGAGDINELSYQILQVLHSHN